MPTALDVATWMFQEVQKKRWLDQETAVHSIKKMFGKDFAYTNENGNPAINRDVLKEFKKLSSATVVWERGDKAWRLRTSHDAPGRQQE